MLESPRIRFSELRSSIHEEFHKFEDFIPQGMHTRRNEFYGATDALFDTIDMLRYAKSLHIKSGESERKLIAYGILNAMYVQQDSVGLLAKIILLGKVEISGPIRVLRNRLAGHPAFADRNGGTSSIPVQMKPGKLGFQIYGLPDNDIDRFFQADIDDLIDQNYVELLPHLENVHAGLNRHFEMYERQLAN
jgi:hypothetical protein